MIVLPVDEKQQLVEQDRTRSGDVEWSRSPPSLDSIDDEYGQDGTDDETPPPDYEDVPTLLQDLANVQADTDTLGNVSTTDARVSSNGTPCISVLT